MATRHKILIGLQIVFALFVLLGGSPAFAQKAMPKKVQRVVPANDVPWRVESKALQFMHELDKQGYEVLRGYFKLYTAADCDLSYQVLHTCLGNNPAAPYVLPVVPPWPDHPGPGEWVDPATIGAFGQTADGYNVSYRLDPHEALVILAQMPPPADYFGVQTYLFTRAGEVCTKSPQYSTIDSYGHYLIPVFFNLVPNEPPNPPRVQIMADLTDSTNNVVIKNESHSVWEQLRYFVITPNPTMDAAIRGALNKSGIADRDIFTEKIPGQIPEPDPNPCPEAATLRFGLDRQADDFGTVIRYAMPVNGVAADRWRQRLPLVVLRIRNLAADDRTYPWVGFEPRTPSNPPETWYNDPPQNYLDKLTQAVCTSWNTVGPPQDCNKWMKFLNTQRDLQQTGPACVPAWMNCLAPGEDATYQMSGRLQLDWEHFYAVVGPLSTATDNATYVSLGLNSSLRQLGFANISDEQLAGSAYGYTRDVPGDKFFVQYFARDCSALPEQSSVDVRSHCYSIGDTLPDCDPADLECDRLVLSLRGYIRPGTQRASDMNWVLNSKYILLKKPNQ